MTGANGPGVTRATGGVQAPPAQAFHARARPNLPALAIFLAFLGGCTAGAPPDPVDWWHNLQGGPIAQTRPPPPNANAPYPKLGSVPDKPMPPDKAVQAGVANSLIADRANAHYANEVVPLPAPPATPAAMPQKPPPPQTGGEAMNATLPAADAPPATKPPAAKPPAAAPSPHAPPLPVAPAKPSAPTQASATAADITLPVVPDAPPPPPALSGVTLPNGAPTPAPMAPPPPPAKLAGMPAGTYSIPFGIGSSILTTEALSALKTIAILRGSGSVAVTGFGDATSSEPAAQTAALALALARAHAVAADLTAHGVPAAAIRLDAAAQGNGAGVLIVK